jgi:hypothetical protein
LANGDFPTLIIARKNLRGLTSLLLLIERPATKHIRTSSENKKWDMEATRI